MSLRAALILASLLMASSTSPTSAQRVAIGEGIKSCGTWTKERQVKSQASHMFATWVLGYASGANWRAYPDPDFLAEPDAEGILAWVDNYCRAHPIDTIGKASEELIYFLERRAGKR